MSHDKPNDCEDGQSIHHQLDTQGLICPEPVMLLHRAIRKAATGERIEILATDPATTRDIPNFCRHLGHRLLESSERLTPQHHPSQSSPDSDLDNSDLHNNDLHSSTDAQTHKLYRYVVQKK